MVSCWITMLFILWRFNMCTSKKRSIQDLPPSSECLKEHLRRCHYFICLRTTLLKPDLLCLKPTLFGWIYQGSTLYTEKCFLQLPTDYFITFGCITCTRKCSSRYSDVECKLNFIILVLSFTNYWLILICVVYIINIK